MQLKELSEDEFVDRNEESGYDRKDDDIPEEMMSTINFPLKELPEIFHNIKRARGKMLEVHPAMGKSETICKA